MRVGRIFRGVLGAVCALGLGLALPARADEPQYRRVLLADGRELYAEILSTEPKGLRMRIPQGETLISFELLVDMQPSTLDEYERNQKPWIVVYDAPANYHVGDLLRQIGSIEAYALDSPIPGISAGAQSEAQSRCGTVRDAGCLAGLLQPDDGSWLWVVTIDNAAEGSTGLSAVAPLVPGGVTEKKDADLSGPDAVWNLLHELLQLGAPQAGPRPPSGAETTAAKRPFDEGRVMALSFVPVPGLPSLAQGDSAGFALALGVVVPSTALWLGAVGNNGQSALETGVITLGGYYAVTVLANQVAGMRSMERKRRVGVSAAPTIGGGAQVVLVGR